jgi:hypothetical protein
MQKVPALVIPINHLVCSSLTNQALLQLNSSLRGKLIAGYNIKPNCDRQHFFISLSADVNMGKNRGFCVIAST